MSTQHNGPSLDRAKHVEMMRTPECWLRRPFLPLIRPRGDDWPELGLLYDALGTSGRSGYQTTVFLANLLDIGATVHGEEQFLALEHIPYPSHEVIYDDGWRVD